MNVNQKPWDPQKFVTDLKKRSEEKIRELEQEKEKLKQKILSEWNQYKSIFFWGQCFKFVDFDVIKQTYKNVIELEKSGYPVNNKAGLFVSTLKKMGYFPWKEEDSEEKK